MRCRHAFLSALVVLAAAGAAAGDWPMWRYDAARTAAAPDELPSDLYLEWVLELPTPAPAWPGTQTKLQFDASYEPVVMGDRVFVPSMVHDSVTAYDTETGDLLWRFYADGPVRFAPAAAAGKVYFASDDGNLYCLDAASGALLWKFTGAPSNRRVLGNERLVSSWPARGAPVVRDGEVYFAASIWPFMGIFIYALDAATGEVVWCNSGIGSRWTNQPHTTALSFASVAPQGHLVATDDMLLVPGGRSVPAGFDRATGTFVHFNIADRTWDRDQGGYAVAAMRDWFFCGPGRVSANHPGMFDLATSVPVQETPASVLTEAIVYELSGGAVQARDLSGVAPTLDEVWSVTPSVSVSALYCKAGSRLYAGGPGQIVAVEDLGGSGIERWAKPITGTPTTMLAASGKLFVVTEEGYLYCFGENDTGTPLPSGGPPPIDWPLEDEWTTQAQAILAETGVDAGYALVLGLGTGRLAEELVRHSDLCVIGFDPSAVAVEALRARWDAMHVPGERLCALAGDACAAGLPPYVADLAASEDTAAAENGHGSAFVEAMFSALRPYGGVACFPSTVQALFEQAVAAGAMANAEVEAAGGHILLTRVGALPGSADWTHDYADAANTVKSDEQLVKAPLGVLWFGGSSHTNVLPRHGHGPSEQVVGGRLFIEGPDHMRGVDVYTGRVLWEASLPGVGARYDNTSHEPGAMHTGSNYATATDGVYVAYGSQCLRLDPATGETASTLTLLGDLVFSQVKIWDDLLVVAADPVIFDGEPIGEGNWNATCSNHLYVLDRDTGDVQWSRSAANAFHHNTIIVGQHPGGPEIVFCIDRMPPGHEAKLRRRGLDPEAMAAPYTLLALDARTGGVIWSTSDAVTGTWLGYSEEYDVLLQSGRLSRDMAPGEPCDRLTTYRGADGAVLWDKAITMLDWGPYIFYGSSLISQTDMIGSCAFDVLTGDKRTREHPLTGESVDWAFSRTYGCGTAIACENLLTFRSGAAGYYAMDNLGGTGNLGGFKSGCTPSLIPANGVLNAPDYTRTCTCSYQNQTSLALIHMPEAEMWTYSAVGAGLDAVVQVGVNFGAPGDRMADNGALWVDYPSVGHTSPFVSVVTEPAEPAWFRYHAAQFSGAPMAWVGASGAVGLTSVTLGVGDDEEKAFTVRLYFAEPDADVTAGQRVFSIQLQGDEVLSDFDVAAAAGGSRRTVMREFTGVNVVDALEVALVPAPGSAIQDPVLCGIEALIDSDADGLGDLDERMLGTSIDYADTDGDDLSDYIEVWYDGDGAYDPYHPTTNPSGTDLDANNPDTDGDGIEDGAEIGFGTDPLVPDIGATLPAASSWALAGVVLLVLLAGARARAHDRA